MGKPCRGCLGSLEIGFMNCLKLCAKAGVCVYIYICIYFIFEAICSFPVFSKVVCDLLSLPPDIYIYILLD